MSSNGSADGKRRSASASEMLATRKGPKSHVPWKEAYKERCRTRLKKRRVEILFRHGLSEELHTAVAEDCDLELGDEANESILSMNSDCPLQRRSSPTSADDHSFFADSSSAAIATPMTRGSDVDTRMETRHMVCEVMSEEWSAAVGDLALPSFSTEQLPFMPTFNPAENVPSDVNELCSLMDELEEELRADEAAILEQYREQVAAASEKDLCSALASLSTDELLCPLCEQNYLLQHLSVIFCQCGLRIDTEQDGINLQFMKTQLQMATDQHGSQCSAKPAFSEQSLDGRSDVKNLILLCATCDFFFIIL
ncbi:RPA-interacting protein A-like [Sycon ciliatum]|uniref:RPA-interacting protein A-like n=1 Tax=Sycon ciliatum TaxID=27933 RepID=UPI0020AD30A8|eukprot:scpid80045/ scgid27422/ RPA-interacting protein A; RPA-interacting protein alpha; XRIPalpha